MALVDYLLQENRWTLQCNESGYCGWLKFRGVPIFVVFVEGPIN